MPKVMRTYNFVQPTNFPHPHKISKLITLMIKN
jgi:hypothetical protein